MMEARPDQYQRARALTHRHAHARRARERLYANTSKETYDLFHFCTLHTEICTQAGKQTHMHTDPCNFVFF